MAIATSTAAAISAAVALAGGLDPLERLGHGRHLLPRPDDQRCGGRRLRGIRRRRPR